MKKYKYKYINEFIENNYVTINLNEYKEFELIIINKILSKNDLDNIIKYKNSKILNFIGLIYHFKYKKLKEAKEYYLMSIESDKNNKYPFHNLGIILEKENKIEEAKLYYLKAIVLKSNLSINNYACLLYKQNKIEEAKKYFLKAIELNVSDAMVNYAYILEKENKIKETTKYYLKAIELNNSDAMYYYALLLKKEHKNNESNDYLLKAIKLNNNEAFNYYKNIKLNIFDKYNNLKTVNSKIITDYIIELEKLDIIKKYINSKKIDECFICYNDNIEVIEYKCNNKHYLCKDCYFLVSRCPYCRL